MKVSGKLALCLILFLTLPLLLFSEPVAQLKPSGYVNDFAHVLDANTAAQLNDLALQVDEKAHAQIAVVTVNSLDGAPIEDYAVNLFKQWGIGDKNTNRGVLILLAVKDHRYRTEVGYGLEPILPDGKVGGFGREAVPLLKQDNYNGAVLLMTSRVADVIARDAGIQITGQNPQPPQEPQAEPSQGLSGGGLLLLIGVILLVLLTPLRRILFWLLLFGGTGGRGGWGSSGGGWGGGGFGGGGGGFGGFGGGMSGGGGASGGW
jgi:uncharacterized protein